MAGVVRRACLSLSAEIGPPSVRTALPNGERFYSILYDRNFLGTLADRRRRPAVFPVLGINVSWSHWCPAQGIVDIPRFAAVAYAATN